MPRQLHLAKDLALPPEAVTETFGILAKRGAGKTTTATDMAEEMYAAKLPFVVIDPVGVWWGLRSGKDGKSPGLKVLIFGGDHGDVPLERTGGTLVADLIAKKHLSCVLDISTFESEQAKKQFLLDFARRLYQKNRHPLHLFLEEGDEYCPQRPMRDEAYLLRAWENIVRRGRSRGLGITLITQRSAALNKNVLTQVGTLIVMRTTGPQDRAAIEAWVKYNDERADILESLPSLRDGEAWVWSPHFLKTTVRVQFRQRKTYDAAKTPTMRRRQSATLADIDIAAVRTEMAASIESAKKNDPAELRRRIQDLEAQLRTASTSKVKPASTDAKPSTARRKEERRFVRTLKKQQDKLAWQDKRLRACSTGLSKATHAYQTAAHELERATATWKQLGVAAHDILQGSSDIRLIPLDTPVRTNAMSQKRQERRPLLEPGTEMSFENGTLVLRPGGGRKRLLIALAQRSPLNKKQLGVRAGMSSKSGTFGTYLGQLRSAGWVDGTGDHLSLTEEGRRYIGHYEPLPEGQALLEYWCRALPGGASRMLRALANAYPQGLTKAQVGEAAQISPASGTFGTYLGKLRTLELVTGSATLNASDEFFPST